LHTKHCLPHLEYASAAWDPTYKQEISGLVKIQTDAVRFIANIKARENVGSAMKKLCLQPLEQKRRTRRINLMKILAKEAQHLALSPAYDDLLNKPTNSTIQTRFHGRGQCQVPEQFSPKQHPGSENWSQSNNSEISA